MNPATQTVPPHAAVMQLLMGKMISAAVSALAGLGVPDHLGDEPQSAEELARKVGAQPGPLYRLMRACASVGVVAEDANGKFSQTPMSKVLRSPDPSSPGISLRAWAMFNSHELHMQGWEQLENCVRTGQQAMNLLHGKHAFQLLAERPGIAKVFNDAMTDLSRLDSPAVAEAYSFEGIRTIADIGGGHGLLLDTILKRHPHISGTLYDTPAVIEGARSTALSATFLGGNMFDSIPPGYDAYIMKHVIHDWPDDACLKILRGCRSGIHPGGKLLVVETVIQPGSDFDPGKFLDLEMLIFPGGHERTEAQFRDLFAAAGWRLNRLVPTRAGPSIVEGVPA